MIEVSLKICSILNINVLMCEKDMGCGSTQYNVVQGDTGPQLKFCLKDCDNNPLSVSGVSAVSLYLKHGCVSGHTNNGHELCSSVSGSCFTYDLAACDLAYAGTYFGDIEVLFLDGKKQTAYDVVRLYARESNK